MPPDIQIESNEKVQIVRCLVVFRGEILLVMRFMRKILKETYDFKVFRLDFGQMEWVKLDSLGDFSIFFGRNCTRCYSSKELGVNKGNCIYFSNESGPMSLSLNKLDHRLSYFGINDWGIFRLNNGDSEVGSESFSCITNKDPTRPVWLTAPLSWYFEEFRL
ncbi:hypothetical protein Dsin_022371 [Dipteronia sinensis]|uniref:KIB1-4 beta-propeller domain-containing protein n=1 Tax=Dipteronia sinensis TaxID=43782 RepID=A0AAE0DZV6_9ROSI|nr:hypothetical protein Dsin_022371 [Dipteronia sinensis]